MAALFTEEQAQVLIDAYYACNENKAQAARSLGMKRTTYNHRLDKAFELGIMPSTGGDLPNPMGELLKSQSGRRAYFISAAQNATPIKEGFRRSIGHFCTERNAQFIAIPFRYKNPTSIWTDSQKNAEYWHPWVEEHLVAENINLNNNLMLAADIKIRPTVKRPLSSLETFSGERSAIFGHSKIELMTVPTPQNVVPKVLTTTGCCTVENYTDSKDGALGESRHVLGGIIVEIEDDDTFHMRQVYACEDGSFMDLDQEFTPRGVKKAPRPEALVCADLHHQQMDPEVEAALFDEGGIVPELKPKRLVFHDLLDFKSQNHHDDKNFFEVYRKHREGSNDVYKEVLSTLSWLNERTQGVEEIAVVESNHNEAFMRWLNEGRGDKDPLNAWFYHNTWAGILPEPVSEEIEIGHPLEYWYRKWFGKDHVRFLRRNEVYLVGNINHGMHGDVGSNGAKGAALGFDKIGVPSTIGHGHGPRIFGGVHQVGVAQLYMRYNERGPSDWLPAHNLQYANGKRTLLISVTRRWQDTFKRSMAA